MIIIMKSELPSWDNLTCDECKKEVDSIIELGEEPDYDSATARVCRNCLSKAMDMINGAA